MDIEFIFSNLYEYTISGHEPVPFKHGKEAADKMTQIWSEVGAKVEGTLFKITGLSFTEKIKCYINSVASFSDPLSIKIGNEKDMLDDLVHELIHVLLTQNIGTIKKRIDDFHASYPKENFTTRIHILVHAIHELVAKELFPDRVEAIRTFSVKTDYRRSWDIVKEIGAENIVKSTLR